MTDRELLERAAISSGHAGFSYEDGRYWIDGPMGPEGVYPIQWNPLEDNGDAFLLLTALRLCVSYSDPEDGTDAVNVYRDWGGQLAGSLGSDAQTTRRAIVRAAAQMTTNEV